MELKGELQAQVARYQGAGDFRSDCQERNGVADELATAGARASKELNADQE